MSARRSRSRRDFLLAAVQGVAAVGAGWTWSGSALAETRSSQLTIRKIDRVTVRVPYRETPRRAMDRELPHWRYAEIFSVELQSGAIGHGETLLYYTWGATEDEDVRRAEGQNAAALMWDDSLGAGLQMALFDAVAKTAGVPIHRLLGEQVTDRTPLSWWNIDMPPEDMAAECQEALRRGYMSYKTKGRPWFDLWKQLELSTNVVPEAFKIDMDYNATLLDAPRAIPILKELERYPQVDIYETPIPQSDVAGNREICEATRVHVAMHYGTPEPVVAIRQRACDGFVIGGGASRLMRQGHVAEMAEMPFWLQLVGTGVTAAFSLHFGAVLSAARWPAVNCHQLYQHDLLKDPIQVVQGTAAIPQQPGLGHALDWDAIERFRVDKPARRPEPKRLIETRWPDGRRMYTASNGTVNFMLNASMAAKTPYFERGVDSSLLPDDGSERWSDLYRKAQRQPLLVTP